MARILSIFLILIAGCTSQVEESKVTQSENSSETPQNEKGTGNYCVSANDLIVQEGAEITVYSKNSVGCGVTCESVSGKIKCEDGKLTGDVSFTEPACVSQPCRCKYGDLFINVGQKVKFYKRNQGSCEEETLACDHSSNVAEIECLSNGAIRGAPSSEYSFRSCSTPTCFCTLPNGVKIPRGTSRYFYNVEEVGCNGQCYTNDVRTRITCSATGELSGDLSLAKFSSCQVPDCDCELSSGLKVIFGRELTVYSNNEATCGQKCSDFAGKVSCMVRNTPSGAPTQALNYQHSSCIQEACEGDGGGNGGGTGNDYGPGQGWFEDGAAGGGGGSGGPINFIGVSKKFCSTPWKAAKDNIRNQSGNLNGKVSEGSSFVAFNVASVGCNDRCSDHSLVRACTNGVLSGSNSYKFKKCESTCPE